ncbi:MAG: hypothetical protein EOO38_06430 [Cytophagaceae bacterium]|nr:MAG: hypothetical protein EOO38_06430 [Cytophagaceae bacterium]
MSEPSARLSDQPVAWTCGGLSHDGDSTTTLQSIAMDQAALHGLRRRVRDLGLTLVSVLRADPAFPTPPTQ